MNYKAVFLSPVGQLTLVGSEEVLTAVCHERQRFFPDLREAVTVPAAEVPPLAAAAQWLEQYFEGARPSLSGLSLAPEGTDFQKEVWLLLRKISYGTTTTYGALAQCIARRRGIPRMSAQAVGNAVGRNPISILVPCHRVIGADGSLVGFGSGLDVKRQLLQHEGVIL